jgi:integrase
MVAGSLHEKKGYYYIVLSYKDASGKSKTKWISTKLPIKGNKKRAEGLLQEARQRFDAATVETDDMLSFHQFMENWLEMVKPSIELTTYSSYSNNIKRVISPYFKKMDILLRELQPKHIQDFYTHCMNKRGVSAQTVIRYHANIRKALKHAVNTDLIPTNPADKIQRPKPKKYTGSFYDIDEVNKLFDVVRGTKMELPVMLAAFYGLRLSEVIGLKWSAIDFKKGTVSINHTVTEASIDGKFITIEKDRTKNKTSYRTLPLVHEFHEMLLRTKAKQEESRVVCGRSYNKDFLEYLCVDELGNRTKPHYVSRHFGLMLDKNELRKIRYHDLRHTCASLLLAAGVSMKEIQDWLGHSTFATTADIYAHLSVDSKHDSANAMRGTGMALVAQ